MENSTLWGGASPTTQYTVYLGTWTNWSRGRVMGATLTTTRQYGNLFIAFTAFFVSFVASRFWKMACLASHRYYSSSYQQDALHHQRQAVLRNTGSSLEGLLMFTRLAWAWRSSARRCLLRMLPAILTASLLLASFSIAGGFSSQISSAVGSDVLLDGSNCSYLNTPGEVKTMEGASILYSEMARKTGEAANYAQQCYSSSRSGMLDCTSFIVDHVSSTVDTQAPCPFPGTDMCRLQASNLHLDTGLLDSSEFFGLNSPKEQRIFFRNVLECAPLVTESFTQDLSTPVNNYTVYNYGPNWTGTNYTFQVETLTRQYTKERDNGFRTDGADFVLKTYSSYSYNGSTISSESEFIPIPELYTSDGDLHLILLQGNGVYFYANTTDPWYRATQLGPLAFVSTSGSNSTQNVYQPEEAASPLACVEKYQFCNAGKECGPLSGKQTAFAQAASLFNMTAFDLNHDIVPNDAVGSRFYWYLSVLLTMAADLSFLLQNLGPKALQSHESLFGGFMGPLPDDQWQLDVAYWWATRLAGIQAAFVNTVHGAGKAALDKYRVRPFNSHMKEMCDNQKIKSTDYTSFSLFGLYFTYLTGLVIIITSFSLEPVIACLYRRDQARKLKRGEYRYLEWASNGTLQLQRLAYQGIKSGKWSGYTDDIPMTESGALLGDLTQSYPEEARDQKQSPGGPAGKTNGTAVVQEVTLASSDQDSGYRASGDRASADSASEAATGSSGTAGAAPTLVPEDRHPDPVPVAQSTLPAGQVGEDGRDSHQVISIGSAPGSVTLGPGTYPVSPVSPLQTQLEARAPIPRGIAAQKRDAAAERNTRSTLNYS